MEEGQLKHSLIHAVAGALSGGFSRTVVSPLDLIKIRFQVQLEPTTNWTALRRNLYGPSKYTGVLQATKEIFREEGLRGFWRGNVPALLMVMPYTAIQFGVLHELKSIASRSLTSEEYKRWSPYLSYASGSFAGCAATIGTYPFDLLRTILASQGEPKVHPNMRAAFTDIVKTRGFRGLYIGLSPTIVAIIPYAGLQIGSYDTCKRWIKRWNQYQMSKPGSTWTDDNLSSFQHLLCGIASSTSAKALCHPLDVVKKRIQMQGLKRHQKYGARIDESAYKGMLDALRQIFVAEGMHGLYKGILPSLIKSAPSGALTFVAYEFTSDLLESLLT